ncbi:hypothetical protein LIER_44102 [Lithospermum erythrorhizon]|uniref:Uncharacterized protein n=1 Tax=Lithospermum erythrorhizon TaxID=34254 RepID=A0AAV3PMS8_LITER
MHYAVFGHMVEKTVLLGAMGEGRKEELGGEGYPRQEIGGVESVDANPEVGGKLGWTHPCQPQQAPHEG